MGRIEEINYKKAEKKAIQIIIEAQNTKQEWIEGYSNKKMVVVPMDVLNKLTLERGNIIKIIKSEIRLLNETIMVNNDYDMNETNDDTSQWDNQIDALEKLLEEIGE